MGELVQVRSRRWLVEEIEPGAPGSSPVVRLACAEDDAQGEQIEVFWDYEADRRILQDEGWGQLAARGFDPPRLFAAFLHTLRWSCVTATDPNLFQSPFRAGIKLDAYQMEPLRKALRLPRVNLFIADDTGLGKTIEAGLIARELLLRKKAKTIVVAAPPSVLEQWKAELEERFGLVFEILGRDYLTRVRRERRPGRSLYWWRFGEPTPALFAAVRPLGRVIVRSQVSAHHAFTLLASSFVFDQRLVVFAFEQLAAFSILQSTAHEVWARNFGSTLKDDTTCTPSVCFETFPLPRDWQEAQNLEDAGQEYYEFRAALMIRNDEGLTKTYNRFHDPNESSSDIEKLRELHAAMDRAVLAAYGWTDISTDCDFFPDFTETDDEGNEVPKSIRYRWPDEVRDEVLARLLELNAERAEEERLAGLAKVASPTAAEPGGKKPAKTPRPKRQSPDQGDLFS